MIQFAVVVIKINEGYALPKLLGVIGRSSSHRVRLPSSDFSNPDLHYMVYWSENANGRGSFAGVVYQVEQQNSIPIGMTHSESERARIGLLMRR